MTIVVGPLPGKGSWGMFRGLAVGIWLEEQGGYRAIAIGHAAGAQWIVDDRVFVSDDGGWANMTAIAGGMPNLLLGNHIPGHYWENGMRPVIEAKMAGLYNIDPTAPQVTNAEPYNPTRFDQMLFQAIAIVDDGSPSPQVEQKPYSP